MPQTSVSTQQGVALAGQIADLAPHNINSYRNEDTASIPAGVFVVEGTGVNDVINCASGKAVTDLVGVSVRQQAAVEDVEVDEDGFMTDATLGVMTHGKLWVKAEEAVTRGDPVYVRMVAAGAEVFGAIRDDSDSGDCVNCSLVARILDYDSTAGLALIELNMTGRAGDLAD